MKKNPWEIFIKIIEGNLIDIISTWFRMNFNEMLKSRSIYIM